MSATGFLDACGFIPASSGTGNFVVSAAVVGYQKPVTAGAVNGAVYSYRAESADKSEWEEGFGAYTVSTTTLARTTITANSSGGAAAIAFSAAPNVYITATTVDLQNAALLTSGTLPVARVNGGTANQLVQGDGTFQTQGRKLLSTLTASNSAFLSDTASLTSTFAEYEISFENIIPATDEQVFGLQIHSGGAFKGAGYVTSIMVTNQASTNPSAVATTFIPLSWTTVGGTSALSNAAPGLSGKIRIYTPSVSGIIMVGGETFYSAHTGAATATVAGYWNTAGVVDGFEVFMSSGNITSGVVKIYGLN